jgi:hypothetical protein
LGGSFEVWGACFPCLFAVWFKLEGKQILDLCQSQCLKTVAILGAKQTNLAMFESTVVDGTLDLIKEGGAIWWHLSLHSILVVFRLLQTLAIEKLCPDHSGPPGSPADLRS